MTDKLIFESSINKNYSESNIYFTIFTKEDSNELVYFINNMYVETGIIITFPDPLIYIIDNIINIKYYHMLIHIAQDNLFNIVYQEETNMYRNGIDNTFIMSDDTQSLIVESGGSVIFTKSSEEEIKFLYTDSEVYMPYVYFVIYNPPILT
jgi:hypothetical protein